MDILVIDDERDMATLMETVFAPWTVHVNIDGNGIHEYLGTHPEIQCILMDISLPGIDGITLLDQIHARFPFLPVIMLTAYNDMANIRRAMRAGAFDFLTKPVELHDLRSSVLNAIAHRKVVNTVKDSMEKTETVLHEAIRILTDGMRIATQIKQHAEGLNG